MSLLLRLSVAVGVLTLLVVGLLVGLANDHGTVQPVTVVPLTNVAERPIDNGQNTDCRATVATSQPRHVVRRIEVPCGVTKGTVTTSAYLYADNTISFDDPQNRIGIWVTCLAIGAVTGLFAFALSMVAGMIAMRVIRWREER